MVVRQVVPSGRSRKGDPVPSVFFIIRDLRRNPFHDTESGQRSPCFVYTVPFIALPIMIFSSRTGYRFLFAFIRHFRPSVLERKAESESGFDDSRPLFCLHTLCALVYRQCDAFRLADACSSPLSIRKTVWHLSDAHPTNNDNATRQMKCFISDMFSRVSCGSSFRRFSAETMMSRICFSASLLRPRACRMSRLFRQECAFVFPGSCRCRVDSDVFACGNHRFPYSGCRSVWPSVLSSMPPPTTVSPS